MMTRTNPDQLSVPPDGKPYHEQPQWRNDFPIDWPQDELVARRDFTKFLVLTSFAFAVGQIWIAFENFARKRRGRPPIQPEWSRNLLKELGRVEDPERGRLVQRMRQLIKDARKR